MNQPLHWTILTLEVPAIEAEGMVEYMQDTWDLSPVLLERPGAASSWIELYLADEREAESWKDRVGEIYPVRAFRIRDLGERDWLTFWQHHFKPHTVGHSLWIVPEWERDKPAPVGRTQLIIDPGLSFGTGDHFTTRFCLEQIEKVTRSGHVSSLWDAGCGSGILGIAAAVLGVPQVYGTDADPQCLIHSAHNAALNSVSSRTDWQEADITKNDPIQKSYDVVVANLFALLLLESAPRIWSATRERVILSGIREFEVDSIADCFLSLGAKEVTRDGDGEWAGVVFQKTS